jgi:FkbM family methyltransferase
VVPFVGDSVLLVSRGMTGATGNVYVGLHECDDMGFFLHFLRPGDLFLDVGANVGTYTVLAASAARSRCIAVEPIPSTFGRLMDNVRINRLETLVETHCVALGASGGTLRFSTDLDTRNHAVAEDYAGAKQLVDVAALDELLGERVPVAMKIDVEGFEREVLRGAPRFLANRGLKAILMEATELHQRYDADGEPSACSMLEDAGFSPHRYDACTRTLSPCPSSSRSDCGNSLYLRDVGFVRERLSTAQTFRVGPWRI